MPDRVKREYAQLLRLHERLLLQLQRIREDLGAPGTRKLLKEIRSRTGADHEEQVSEVVHLIEEAMRTLKLSESEMQSHFMEDPRSVTVEGIAHLPAPLARFLAERQDLPGFSYEVSQDEIRGWVISWKEKTTQGHVRGSGKFYERPYAWLED